MTKQTTIIIVTYKSAHIVEQALKNIVNKGYPIIIIDNNSNDSLEEFLKQNYQNSQIELIKLANNVGFSKANNIVLRKTKTKYAFLLNPDAIITENSIENLVKQANKNKNIALAGAFDSRKENPTPQEISQAIIGHKKTIKIINENDDYIETNFICGGYMLLKMAIFEKIGFLDENLFLYGEDEEICDRVIANNYKIIQVKNSLVYHNEHSATKTNGLIEKYYLLYKRYNHMGWSRVYLKRKRGKKTTKLFASLVWQLLSSLMYLVTFRLNGFIIRLGRAVGGLRNLLFYKENEHNTKIHL
jgi:N-acetylglucosaminyl-diphospho-decaprenol L-rhamnosyltransferase